MTSFQCIIRSLLGILVFTGSLLQHAPAQAQGFPPAPSATPPGVTRATASKSDTNRTVELKFNQAALDMVLQYYCSELTGRTLLQAPNVNATITLRSQTELTVPEAIQAIKAVLAMNNIALINQGDKFVKAVPITAAPQEGLQIQSNQTDQVIHPETDDLVSEVIPLKFIDPAEAQKAITGLIHAYGKILPLERINSLLVADTSVNLNRIKDILTRVDQPLDIKESIHILQMRNSKPSDIKTKLEEIIADQKDKEKQPTVRRLRDSGAPGVDTTPAPVAIPGVIRARSVVAGTSKADATESEASDDRMIRGNVKVIADDRTGSLIIITRQENMKFFEQVVAALDVGTAPDVTIEVMRLEYADAEEVASMLNALIGAAASPTSKSSAPKKTASSGTGSTRPDGTPGATTTPAAREEPRSYQLQEFIEQQRQLASAKGPEGKTKVGQLSAENIKILADKRTNGLILMASKADMAALKDILKGMDIMLSQVLIEAVIMQVSLDKNLERGVDWVQRSMIAYNKDGSGGRNAEFGFAGAGGGGKGTPINATTINSSAGIGGAGGLTYYFTQFGLNIDAVIKMSQSDNRSKIIASPVILTTDNKEAKIDVSEERYFYKGVSYTGYSVSGTQQQAVPNVESRKVGLTLTVTPRINAKKFVVMEIAQKIENINGTQTIDSGAAGGANEWPIVASREMNASVSVRSGETIILGGLVENNNTENKNGIPFLNKIPFLGFLFGSASDTGKRSEIVVFITPYVLDSPEEIETESARRKAALSAESTGMWEKGWSDSNLADPPKNSRGWKSLLK